MNHPHDESSVPLATDSIFLITVALQEDLVLREALLSELNDIIEEPAYVEWATSIAQRDPFDVTLLPRTAALEAVGLAASGHLQVKVNKIRDSILLTDGVWIDGQLRTFPFADESSTMHQYCASRGFLPEVDAVIDLATGSGSNLAYLRSGVPGVGFDINPRALAYFQLNQTLNGNSRNIGCLNDIRNGFHDVHPFGDAKRPLILSNMPFGLAPNKHTLGLTSDGGETGLSLQRYAFEAVARFRETPVGQRARVVMLGYSVGHAGSNNWEMVQLAKEILGERDLCWSMPAGEVLLRVDGRRSLRNPSPISLALDAAGGCRLYHDDPTTVQQAYAELSKQLIRSGATDLAYLIIELQPASESVSTN